jgi:hypothetical protein
MRFLKFLSICTEISTKYGYIRIVEFLFSSPKLNVHESHFAPIVIVVCALAIHISVFFPMKSLQQTEPYLVEISVQIDRNHNL